MHGANMRVLNTVLKITQIQNIMKIGPVGVKPFHVDGCMDWYDKANGRF